MQIRNSKSKFGQNTSNLLPIKVALSRITSDFMIQFMYGMRVLLWAHRLRPFFSEIYLQDTENTEICDILLKYQVEGYFRYIDDILILYVLRKPNKHYM